MRSYRKNWDGLLSGWARSSCRSNHIGHLLWHCRLLLGRYRFFLKLLAGAALAYLIVAGITILAGGVEYGIRQYQDYFGFLSRLTRDYPWWGPDKPFLGYNHSIMQIVLYSLGVSAANMRLATILKLILLIPLGWISLKFLRNPSQSSRK